MKYITKIIAFVLSALTLASGSAVAAGAAQVKKNNQVKVICNDCAGCKTNQLLSKNCKGKSCKTTAKKQKGYCPDGNCSTNKPLTKSKKQSAKNSKKADTVQKETAGFNTKYEEEVLSLVNAERKKKGLSALAKDSGAVNVAHLRAKEIVKSFSHTRPNGSSCFTAAKELGVSYKTAGENIAYGYSTPEQVVKGWMNSEGHRKNILSASFKKIGIGCYKSGNTLYWSQFFIG